MQNISVDDDPSRGAERLCCDRGFTDFQCPHCAAMHPVIEGVEVLRRQGEVCGPRFPSTVTSTPAKLRKRKRRARARKFFEYAALLFKRQQALDVASRLRNTPARRDWTARFDAALDRGTYSAEVKRDIQDGEMYGVGVTPTIL